MAKAVWKGTILVESDDIAHVEGNAYFPLGAIGKGVLSESSETPPTYCNWKGIARYYDVTVGGETNIGGAWYYPAPYPQAEIIADRVAFWREVDVTGVPEGRGLVEGEPRLDGKTGWEALCWLIKFSDTAAISMVEIEKVTGITEGEIEAAWQLHDVQRYATRYKRSLAGGGTVPWSLVLTD
jgi:uncharacterized protein (DUF427 family)